MTGLQESEAYRVYTEASVYVTEWFGERCPDWEKDCLVCRMWDAIDTLNGQREPRYHYREGAEQTPVATTVPVSNSINVDLDANGDVVGVEIL